MQQITPTLYIGDQHDAMNESCDSKIDVLIYLGQQVPEKLCFNCRPFCIHLPLNDGKNDVRKLRQTLFIMYTLFMSGDKMMITCRAGISRSVIFTTAMYALTRNMSYDEAYDHIKQIRPQSQPELHLKLAVKKLTEELKNVIY